MPASPEAFAARTQQLKGELVEQGRRVRVVVESAFDALFSKNPGLAAQVEKLDDEVDNADVRIEQQSVSLLTDATREGAHLDPAHLRTILTIVKVNNELERIADVAVDVAELVAPVVNGPAGGKNLPDTFRVMANSVIGILRDTTAALHRNDPALAKVVLQSQHTVTAFKAAIVRDCEERIAKGTMAVDLAFMLHEVANLCEFLADHCTNIAEQVIYVCSGMVVRHEGDRWTKPERV